MMKSMHLIMLLIIAVSFVQSQSMFLDAGQQGAFMVSGGYSTSDDATGFGGAAGYSINGVFDIFAGYGTSSPADDEIDDMKTSSLSFGSSYHLPNEAVAMPISAAVSVSYTTISVDWDYLDERDLNMYGNAFIVSVSLYKKFLTGSGVKKYLKGSGVTLYPYIAFAVGRQEITIEGSYGDPGYETESTNYLGIGLAVAIPQETGAIFIIEPSLNNYEGETQINFTVGMLFNANK
ncbi:MAG: hypothetical protein V3W14_03860 [Candidatus Neomarinimicrobiota bacterium]